MNRDPKASAQRLETLLRELPQERQSSLLSEFRALQFETERLRTVSQQARERNAELELKLDALELDNQRVHRFLDEFEVPRFVEDQAAETGRERSVELSLLGRVELILEDEDEEEEEA